MAPLVYVNIGKQTTCGSHSCGAHLPRRMPCGSRARVGDLHGKIGCCRINATPWWWRSPLWGLKASGDEGARQHRSSNTAGTSLPICALDPLSTLLLVQLRWFVGGRVFHVLRLVRAHGFGVGIFYFIALSYFVFT